MQVQELFLAPSEIREGDAFYDDRGRLHWTARRDAEVMPNGSIRVAVQYADGGCSVREWTAKNADWILCMVRPA